jgi:tRNA (adenine37-N6)-methyltransferase
MKDLEASFLRAVLLLYDFHEWRAWSLTVTPFLDTQARGLLATTRALPGQFVPPLYLADTQVERHCPRVAKHAILDGMRFLDIKSHVAQFDSWSEAVGGWFEKTRGAPSSKFPNERSRHEPRCGPAASRVARWSRCGNHVRTRLPLNTVARGHTNHTSGWLVICHLKSRRMSTTKARSTRHELKRYIGNTRENFPMNADWG